MAKTESAEDKAKSGGGIVPIVAVMVVLALAGGGGGFMVGNYAIDAIGEHAKQQERASRPEIKAEYSGTRHAITLPPVLTNLAKPSTTWARLESAIIYDEAEGALSDALTAEITGDISAFLASLTIAHIEGPSGLAHLKEDLTERAQIRSEGRVSEVIITSLIIE